MILQIDQETQAILDQFKSGQNISIRTFLQVKLQQQYSAMCKSDFKLCYYLQKKIEKVCIVALQRENIQVHLLEFIVDEEYEINDDEKLEILRSTYDIDRQVALSDYQAYLIRIIIQALNNIGVIQNLRKKHSSAEKYFWRALQLRTFTIDHQISVYQVGLLMLNLSDLLQDSTPGQVEFLNKALLILETVEESIDLKIMLNAQSIKTNNLQQPKEIHRERIIYLLILGYQQYYPNLQKEHSQFCKQQIDYLNDIYAKFNSKLFEPTVNKVQNDSAIPQQLPRQIGEQKKIYQRNTNIDKQGIKSQYSNNSSNVTIQSGNIVTDEPELDDNRVIFKKYMYKYNNSSLLASQRFKVIVSSHDSYIQISLYCKPLAIFQSIYITLSDLQQYFHSLHQNSAEELYKSLIKKLSYKNDLLHIRDIRFYRTPKDLE